VQTLVPAPVRLAGLQLRLVSEAGANRDRVDVLDTPLRVAVTVAVVSAVTAVALALNVAVAWPARTVTVPGTVTAALLSDSVTTVPPVGAAPLNVTVQRLVPAPVSEVGVQLNEESVAATGTDTLPLESVTGRLSPAADVPNALVNVTGRVSPPPEERVRFTVATVPSGICVALYPTSMQETAPVPLLQTSVLPAAVAAGDAVRLTAVKSAVEYPSVHCSPDALVVPLARTRFKLTVPPELPVADESDREVWALAVAASAAHTNAASNSVRKSSVIFVLDTSASLPLDRSNSRTNR
jgi:hypothetical protein